MNNLIIPDKELSRVKFIQAHLLDAGQREPFLRYDGEMNQLTHSRLLTDLVREFGIKLETATLSGGEVIAKPKTDRYEICGAGRMDFKDGIFVFYGNSCSSSYVLGLNREHFRELREIDSRFRFRIDEETRMH